MSQSILSLKAVISEKRQSQKQRSELPKKRKEKDDYSHIHAARAAKQVEEDMEEQRRMLALQKKAKLYDALKSSAGSNLQQAAKDSLLIDFSRTNDTKNAVVETREELTQNREIIGKIQKKQAELFDKHIQNKAHLSADTATDDFLDSRDYYEKTALQTSLKHVLADIDFKPSETGLRESNQSEKISHETLSKYIPTDSDALGRNRPTPTGLVGVDHRKELLLQKKKQINNTTPLP